MDYEKLFENFQKHRFHTSFFATKEEAAQYLKDQIHHETVGFGGSMTLKEMNLYDILSEDNEVFWHWITPGKETLEKAAQSSVFILSANGVAETGELVNIDGTGNRIAASLYGPERVYYVIGKNKICPDLKKAMERARNTAGTLNAKRLSRETPCTKSDAGRCYDCNSPERICNAILILERPCSGMEAELVFVDEDLGF